MDPSSSVSLLSTDDSEQKDEVTDCIVFFSHVIDPLPLDLRKELIQTLHTLRNRERFVSNARELANNLIVRIENELGFQHIVCEVVAKELVDCFKELNLAEDAVSLLKDRMDRIEQRDLGTLLALARLHDLTGEYQKAVDIKLEVVEMCKKKNDPILLSLAHAKLACGYWQIKRTGEARNTVRLAISELEKIQSQISQVVFPFSESTLKLLDDYKTIAYLHRAMNDRLTSIKYLSKALQIVKKDKSALVQAFKLETQIGSDSVNVDSREDAREHCQQAYKSITKVLDNSQVMLYHSRCAIAALSTIAYTYQRTGMYKEEALVIREKLYQMAEKYYDIGSPEIARIASETAYLCNVMKNYSKEEKYIQRTETSLDDCGYKDDITKIKMHIRPLCDALKALAFIFSRREDFNRADHYYKETLRINEIVYGKVHKRLVRTHMSLIRLYKEWNKFPEALEQLERCLEIHLKCTPENLRIKNKIQKDIRNVKLMQTKYDSMQTEYDSSNL